MINRDSVNGAILSETSNRLDNSIGLFEGDYRTNFGLTHRLTKNLETVTLEPGETRLERLKFSEKIAPDDLVNVKINVSDNNYVGYNVDLFSGNHHEIQIVLHNPNDIQVTVDRTSIYILRHYTTGN